MNLRKEFEKETFIHLSLRGSVSYMRAYVEWLESKNDRLQKEVDYLKDKDEYNPVREMREERDRRLSG